MSSIIVTGANRGIGFQIAKTLAEQNNTVFATCRDPSKAAELKKLKNVHIIALDVASKDSVAKGIQEISKLAPDGIDELWNNAGVNSNKGAPMDVDCESFLEQININGVGCSRVTQQAIKLLEKKKARRVIFVSSDMGTISAPPGSGDGFAYTTSKVAMSTGAKYWHGHLSPKGYSVTCIVMNFTTSY